MGEPPQPGPRFTVRVTGLPNEPTTLGPPQPPPEPVEPERPARENERRRWLIPAGVGIGLALVGTVVVLATQQGSKPKPPPATAVRAADCVLTAADLPGFQFDAAHSSTFPGTDQGRWVNSSMAIVDYAQVQPTPAAAATSFQSLRSGYRPVDTPSLGDSAYAYDSNGGTTQADVVVFVDKDVIGSVGVKPTPAYPVLLGYAAQLDAKVRACQGQR